MFTKIIIKLVEIQNFAISLRYLQITNVGEKCVAIKLSFPTQLRLFNVSTFQALFGADVASF